MKYITKKTTKEEINVNNSEQYIDIYKELCADGEITERKRKMLNREREELGISEERAKELESKL